MFKTLEDSYKIYMKKPTHFGLAALISVVLHIITIFALLGAFLIVFYLFSLVGLAGVPAIVGVIGGTILIAYLVIMNGLKGALIHILDKLNDSDSRPSVREFFKYGLNRGPVFFVITLIKTIVSAIISAPIYLLYENFILPMELPYADTLLYVVIGAIVFFVEIPFVYAYVSAGVENVTSIKAIKNALRFIKRKHVGAFGMYTVYALVWVTLWIPLVNLITVFATWPIVYNGLIKYYKKYN